MFFWLVALLTVITAPLALLLGRPLRGPVRVTVWLNRWTHGRAKPKTLSAAFPWSSRTPVWQWRAWPWTRWLMRKLGADAMTLLGHILTVDDDPGPRVSFHEAVHVLQQSACPLLGPFGVAVGYVCDLALWWTWRKWVPEQRPRAPLAEQIAYWLDGRDPRDK